MSTQRPEPNQITEPPAAKRIPAERTHHGDTVVDEYAWLADKESQDTISYLEAQNGYTEAMTAGQAGLRDAIFGEIKGRTKETDLSVPTRKSGWWYYSRTEAGRQYAVHCRRAARGDDERPPMSEDGSPLDGEEILLDGNELAGDQPYFALGAFSVSPDGAKLAYSTDYAGDERYTMRFKDLVTGRDRRRRDPRHLLRRGLVEGRLGDVLRDGRRRLAAVPDLAASDRDAGGPGRDGLRGGRRAVLRRGRAHQKRALPGDLQLLQADQRGLAARRRRSDRRVPGRRAAKAGRGIQHRSPGDRRRHRPPADPA